MKDSTLALYETLKKFTAQFVRNESIQQVFKLKLHEQIGFVNYLHELNTKPLNASQLAQKTRQARGFFRLIDRHFQLPCSPETRRQRADWFEKNATKTNVIYLLGDDDLVAVELCQRGFENVYVADCDDKVLDTIKNLTSHLPIKPRLIQADFTDENFGVNPLADIVCIDPPYNKSWAMVFLKTALRCLNAQQDSRLLLMINPHSLGSDFEDLLNHLHQRQWNLRSHSRHFNTYLIGGFNKFLLWLSWSFLKFDCRNPMKDMYFGSDLFVFSPSNNSEKLVKTTDCVRYLHKPAQSQFVHQFP